MAECIPSSHSTFPSFMPADSPLLQAPPVSTFVFVSRLVRPEWLIEVEAVAVIGGAR